MIKILLKKVGEVPKWTEISNDLHTFQKIVGGPIEVLTITDNVACVCNEEGKLKRLSNNFAYLGDNIAGNVIFCGVAEDEFCSLDIEVVNDICNKIISKIETYENKDERCNCSRCELNDKCVYKDKFQRLPRKVGGLSKCAKLEQNRGKLQY